MPSTYDKLGIHFLYPDSWQIEEEDALAGQNTVTVYSPEGAFWSVMFYPSNVEPEEVTRTIVKAMTQTYEQLEAEPIEEHVAGFDLTGFDLNFYCLDLTNTALVRATRTSQRTFGILCQAEDREFADLEGVFRAITHSLLHDSPASADIVGDTDDDI